MKKIMFNDRYGLTEAVLFGRKTQTRRIPKLTPNDVQYLDEAFDFDLRESVILDKYAHYKVGEVVAVAQSYNDCGYGECAPIVSLDENDIATFGSDAGSYNKMFVKADLMPHRIRITNVRVERLPEPDTMCLVFGYQDFGDGNITRYTMMAWYDGEDFSDAYDDRKYRPERWMPIPLVPPQLNTEKEER